MASVVDLSVPYARGIEMLKYYGDYLNCYRHDQHFILGTKNQYRIGLSSLRMNFIRRLMKEKP